MKRAREINFGLLLVITLFSILLASCGDNDNQPTVSNQVIVKALATATTDANQNKIVAKVITPEPTATQAGIASRSGEGAAKPDSAATPVGGTPTATPDPAITVMPTRTPLPAPVPVTSATPVAFSGKGTILDRKFRSPVLNRDMPYRVYLPQGYALSGKAYPVLYMLHGLSGAYDEWIDYHIFEIADQLMSQGTIKPMIIVLPSGDKEYWVDHANNGPQYGYYVARDVVGHIDATYRTLPSRDNRSIGGHSMGGHGSLQIAFNYPEVFGVVGAHSPTLRSKDQAPDYFGDQDFYEAHDPVSLAKNLPVSTLESLKIWIDIGTKDQTWRPRTEELNQNLTDRDIDHTWHLWEGDHGGEYWTEHLPAYLKFYSDGVSGKPKV